MRTSEFKEVTTTAFYVSTCSCDFCGQTYGNPITTKPVTEFTIRPGYGSEYDDEIFRFDICDRCISNLVTNRDLKLQDDWRQCDD